MQTHESPYLVDRLALPPRWWRRDRDFRGLGGRLNARTAWAIQRGIITDTEALEMARHDHALALALARQN